MFAKDPLVKVALFNLESVAVIVVVLVIEYWKLLQEESELWMPQGLRGGGGWFVLSYWFYLLLCLLH